MPNLKFTYNPTQVYKKVLEVHLERTGVEYNFVDFEGRIATKKELTKSTLENLKDSLAVYDIKLEEDQESDLVELVKQLIRDQVKSDAFRTQKLSVLLTESTGYSYSHLSSQFSSKTFMTIENFLIFTKVEHVKELLQNNTISEIAHKLDYSSVPHLSKQFKNVTGLTITEYLDLMDNKTKREK